jgi:iron complex transport system permease protein
MTSASSVRTRLAWTLAGFGVLAAAACVLAPLVGSTSISLAAVFDRSRPYAENIDAQIFFVARLPRVLAAALVGSSLALAGVVFQALLRNPLASPDTLGVSAGASLGAMLAITFDARFSALGISTVPFAAFAGSLGALAIVYGLSTVRRAGTSTLVLLLGGVTLTALLSAVVSFIQFMADFTQTFRNVRWMMGSLDVASYPPILGALLPTIVAWAGFATLPRVLDLVSVGAESAESRGVNVVRTERVALVSASLATGAAVSLAGPVAFVGIIVPHLVRLIVGADHRLVLPASALFGATLLIACDLAARTVMAPLELPVGIVTAIVGAPVFLWLLFRRS